AALLEGLLQGLAADDGGAVLPRVHGRPDVAVAVRLELAPAEDLLERQRVGVGGAALELHGRLQGGLDRAGRRRRGGRGLRRRRLLLGVVLQHGRQPDAAADEHEPGDHRGADDQGRAAALLGPPGLAGRHGRRALGGLPVGGVLETVVVTLVVEPPAGAAERVAARGCAARSSVARREGVLDPAGERGFVVVAVRRNVGSGSVRLVRRPARRPAAGPALIARISHGLDLTVPRGGLWTLGTPTMTWGRTGRR